MASRVALDIPCSNPGDERPCSPAQLWGEAFSGPGGSLCQEMSSQGGPGLGGHTSVVLPFLGVGPETRGRASAFHRVPVSNSFGL